MKINSIICYKLSEFTCFEISEKPRHDDKIIICELTKSFDNPRGNNACRRTENRVVTAHNVLWEPVWVGLRACGLWCVGIYPTLACIRSIDPPRERDSLCSQYEVLFARFHRNQMQFITYFILSFDCLLAPHRVPMSKRLYHLVRLFD